MKVLVGTELRPFAPRNAIADGVVQGLSELGHEVELVELPTQIEQMGVTGRDLLFLASLVVPPDALWVSMDLAAHCVPAHRRIAVLSASDVTSSTRGELGDASFLARAVTGADAVIASSLVHFAGVWSMPGEVTVVEQDDLPLEIAKRL